MILHTLRDEANSATQLDAGKADFAKTENRSGRDLKKISDLLSSPEPLLKYLG
jgi:hypothetical protein